MNKAGHIISAPSDPRRSLTQIGEQPLAQIDRIDLNGSFSFFLRRIRLILACALLGLLVGAAVTFLAPKKYTAEAVVSLVQPADQSSQTGISASSGPTPSSAFVDTQIEIITSREMASQVAQTLGLLQGLDEAERREVLDRMQERVSAERSGESFALRIAFEGDSGEEAAEMVNAYAREFSRWELRLTQERSREEIETIQARIEELRAAAAGATAQLAQYRIANNLLSTSGASLTEQEISSYNQAVTQARAEVAEAQARLNTAMAQLRSGSTGEDVGEALDSTVISSLRIQEATTGAEVANLAARYGPNHPQLVNAREELREIRSRIDAEIGRVISNLRAQSAVAQQRLSSLSGSLSAARSQLSQNNAAMVGLDELERNAAASQELYETYLNSYKQLVASEGTELPNARVLTLAEVPFVPSSPNVLLNMALALVIGLGFGVLAAFIAESLSTVVQNGAQIERDLGERYLGSVPLLSSVSKREKDPARAITANARSAYAESFRSLRTSLEHATFGPTQIIAITSALPREGKTVTATCLAQILALSGARTLLIDCDEARRGVTQLLDGGAMQAGLLEVLSGEASLNDALLNSEAGLSVLPILRSTETGECPISGGAMDDLLVALRDRFDHIVLDLPPVLPVAAARRLAEKADATIMVVRWRHTPGGALASALQQMPRDRINIAGIAMTQVDVRRRTLLGNRDAADSYAYREYYA